MLWQKEKKNWNNWKKKTDKWENPAKNHLTNKKKYKKKRK